MAVDVDVNSGDELVDDLVVARLNSLTRALTHSAAIDQSPPPEDSGWTDHI